MDRLISSAVTSPITPVSTTPTASSHAGRRRVEADATHVAAIATTTRTQPNRSPSHAPRSRWLIGYVSPSTNSFR